MQLSSLRTPLATAVVASSLLAPAAAQDVAATPASPPPAAKAPAAASGRPAAATPDAKAEGLPSMLLLVPGGTVELGMPVEALIAACSQAASPAKPENAVKVFPKQLKHALRNSLSILGRKKVDVAPFYLGRWPVTNKEYESYVAARRAAGAKVRPPFLWWQEGRKDDFEKKLPDIAKEFPKMEQASVLYWERHGHELEYKLVDKNGKSIAKLPVVTISWRDANEFAGWLGMRLPTEIELTRAMRGDGTHAWPTAVPTDPATDVYSEAMLKKLQIFESRDKVLKPVGTNSATNGPFGHFDMFGQVWQLCGDLGFRPIHGTDVFVAEWKKLQKDKAISQIIDAPPAWAGEKVFAKGGSFMSGDDPIQLLIDARAPMQTIDVLQSVGMRLAKSLQPGYDMLFSLLRGSYNRNHFGEEQDTDMTAQVGAERYELGADGFPTSYQAISLAPVNWLSKEKNADLQKLLDRSQVTPLLIGTLALTMPLREPKLPGELYSVLYRKAGVPKELTDAIKQGHKDLIAAQKAKPKDEEAKPADGGDEKDKDDKDKDKKDAKKNNWRTVVARFGLTDTDILSKEAADGQIKFIRIDGLEVPIADDVFLLHGNEGKVVGVVGSTNAQPAVAAAVTPAISIEADAKVAPAAPQKGGAEAPAGEAERPTPAVANIRFGVPLLQGTKKLVEFRLRLQLDHPAPTDDKPWRSTK